MTSDEKSICRQHAVTVIAWFCECSVAAAFNQPRFRLKVFVSEGRQIRQPLHVAHKHRERQPLTIADKQIRDRAENTN